MIWRYRLVLLAACAAWVGGAFLIDSASGGVPLVSARFKSWEVVAYLVVGLLLLILLVTSLFRRSSARDWTRRYDTLSAYLNDGIMIMTPRGRLRWHNDAAAALLEGGKSPPAFASLAQRAYTGKRTTMQTLTLGEGVRYSVQAVPLDRLHVALICHALQADGGRSTFYENFIRRIVHDMRNPLAGIIGHAANLQQAPTMDDDSWRKSAATIETEAQRLARLVDSMLFDARLAYVPLAMSALDLVDLLEEAVYAHDEQAEREGKTLELEAPPARAPILGDHDLLVRAFENLIDNSLKYSDAGGRLKITLQAQPAGYVITFEDNGSGIPPDYLPDRIFEPLVRARPHGSGSGLGLSIARKIFEMHGGNISAASKLGEGTTMTVRLPRSAEGT